MSLDRRKFIVTSAAVLFQIRAAKDKLIVRSESPTDFETPVQLLDKAWITPNDLHYVRAHLPTPAISLNAWNLAVDGEVSQPLNLTINDIRGFKEIQQGVTL